MERRLNTRRVVGRLLFLLLLASGPVVHAQSCSDGNPCTFDTGLPPNCMHLPSDGGTCDDGNFCTTGDRCFGGHCSPTGVMSCQDGDPCTTDGCVGGGCIHAPVPAPSEPSGMIAADKATFNWQSVVGASTYDVLRGDTASFPVGTGVGETCFNDLATATVSDPAIPLPDAGFWYLSRSGNSCAQGTFGTQHDGTPRSSTTCP